MSSFTVSNGEGTLTMAEVSTATNGKRRQSRISMAETIEFRFIAALAFAVCLIGFAARRISGRAPKGQSYMQCVRDARSAAHAAAGYAFHG
jgi:hypothetical protein